MASSDQQAGSSAAHKEETMMKRLLLLLLPLALVPATGAGGFFDDFDGEDLGTHWEFGNPKGTMIYSVHDSLLQVSGFAGPGNSHEWITARLPRYDDFEMEARVGWTDAPTHEALAVALGGGYPRDSAVAQMYFRRATDGGQALNKVGVTFRDGPSVEVDAPSSGFHTFRLTRSAGLFSAYFNEDLILQGTGSGMPADTIVLLFSGRFLDSTPVDLLVDRVSVVPEPASIAWLAAGVAVVALRRRRTR
ncbi:MAG: PEP-CTERM sorting domain-containing protein [Armatimonadota bacterium]